MWTMCEFNESNCNGFGDMWWTDKCTYFRSIDVCMHACMCACVYVYVYSRMLHLHIFVVTTCQCVTDDVMDRYGSRASSAITGSHTHSNAITQTVD